MSRNKAVLRNDREYSVPTGVSWIVRAVCADYDRRVQRLRNNDLREDAKETCLRLNKAVDDALISIETGMKKAMIDDIRFGRGYDHSPASLMISKNTYYRRKRKVVFAIASNLCLI